MARRGHLPGGHERGPGERAAAFGWLALARGVGLLVAGVAAYILEDNGFPIAPAILGVVLGGMLEENFITSMIKSDGDLLAFVSRPVAATLAARFGYDVPLLGRIPLDTALRAGGDTGTPIVTADPGSASSGRFYLPGGHRYQFIWHTAIERESPCRFDVKSLSGTSIARTVSCNA